MGALGSALIAGVVAYAVARGNRKASPYEALADRVVVLERQTAEQDKRIQHLERENAGYQKEATAHRFRVGRLLAHIDMLTGLLAKYAPSVSVPLLDEADRQA